jgi:hypothetical protein
MKIIKIIIYCLLGFFLMNSGCWEDYCDEVGDLSKDRTFRIIDEDTERDLITQSQVYDLDTIDLTADGISVISYRYEAEGISAEFGIDVTLDLTIHNEFDYLLYLNSTDTDTLRVFATPTTDKCSGQPLSSIEHIIYRGDTIRNEHTFVLKK